MLEQLHLNGFQKHKDLVIDFEQVTTIVGPTDSGKSSVIRALRWLFLGAAATAPAPVSGGDAYVAVTAEGRKVARRRGDENVYYLDAQEFRAFRTNVPDPIAAFLSVQPVNFQGQHDSMYWLSSTSPEVSRQLNELVDLEIIDETLSRMASQVRTSTVLFDEADTVLKTKLAAYKESKASAASFVEFDLLKSLHSEIQLKEIVLEALARGVQNYESCYELVEKAENHRKDIESLRDDAQAYGSRRSTLSKLAELILKVEFLQKTVEKYKDLPSLDSLDELRKNVKDVTLRLDSLKNVIYEIEDLSDTLSRYTGISIENLAKDYEYVVGLAAEVRELEHALKGCSVYQQKAWEAAKKLREAGKELAGICLECGRPYE